MTETRPQGWLAKTLAKLTADDATILKDAAAEIDRRAGDRRFGQILLSPKSQEPLGRKRYWPIYAAAERAGLPIAFHPAATGGGHPSSGAGWPTYYLEEHNTFGTIMQGSIFEMHPMVGLFIGHACCMISKTLHIPKP